MITSYSIDATIHMLIIDVAQTFLLNPHQIKKKKIICPLYSRIYIL
jgi:hypothetical protein